MLLVLFERCDARRRPSRGLRGVADRSCSSWLMVLLLLFMVIGRDAGAVGGGTIAAFTRAVQYQTFILRER